MKSKTPKTKKGDPLIEENLRLRSQLQEAEETLRAVREGEVDAIIASGSKGDQVFSLVGAESVHRLIVETMKAAAVTLTIDGKILYCNRQFSELMHISLEQIPGRQFEEFVLPDERSSFKLLLARSAVEPVKQRLVFRSSEGECIPALISTNILPQPDAGSICIVATDLTELESSAEVLPQLRVQREALSESEQRYRAPAEFSPGGIVAARERMEREGLDTRVRERTAELLQTVDRLNSEISQRIAAESALRDRTKQLSALVAHLTVAEEQERRRITGILHDDLQQLLVGAKLGLGVLNGTSDKVEQASSELDKILSQSIEVTRSLTAELSPPVLHLGGFIQALEWLAQWMKHRHGLEVDLKADERLNVADEQIRILLFQSVRELLFNVVKHARVPRASVTVGAMNDQIKIVVSDQGIGFDPAGIGSQSGGFGLFSIQERLNSLGGRVEADTMPGRGSRFRLLVPLSGTAAEGEKIATHEYRRIRILVVDDHVIMRQGLAHLLKAQPDMEVVGEASNGESAIRMARQFLPDVIVMDVSMPVMNGTEATRVIHSEMPDVQVIGLSMFDEEEKAETMRRAGAVRYLSKTGPSNMLIAAIRESARSARQHSITQ